MCIRLFILSITTSLLTTACSSAPTFNTDGVNTEITPQLIAEQKTVDRSMRVFWGGDIIKTTNLKSATHIEVLSRPLSSNGSPNTSKEAGGRFIIERQGFLDPAKYTNDRSITVVGTVMAIANGKVGKASYRFPVVKPVQLHLWPKQSQKKTNIHFGVGVGVSR